MEKPQYDIECVPTGVSTEARPMPWVAPLQSMSVFSVAEFTQTSASPGDDSSGIFTAS